jgi:6-phosphogluconate dehydrogenase
MALAGATGARSGQTRAMGADIGVIGLAVMGQNLVLNLADHGYRVAVHNRTAEKTHDFLDGPGQGAEVEGHDALEGLVGALERPRRILLMVQAGPAVDAVLEQLVPMLDEGDLVLDAGNSRFDDTQQRTRELEERGLRFLGIGVSGGEEGARRGPSIMPGGSPDAWPLVAEPLQAIAAKAADGTPCCEWLGPDGAGHFVKMVHNGIEYGDMQVIAEAYDLMAASGRSNDEMAEVFRSWNDGVLDSFLIEITAEILAFRDPDGRSPSDQILDAAGQKGTGKWTVIASLDSGQPLTLVAEALYARTVSSLYDLRQQLSERLAGPPRRVPREALDLDDLRDAVYASKLVSYSQGFMLLRAASDEHGWDLDLRTVASLWRAGCIIRARLLGDIMEAFTEEPGVESLLGTPMFAGAIADAQDGWRRVVSTGIVAGVPLPAFSSALAFYDGLRSARLPANLIQAQRDYFGAHTYERVDKARGEAFHTDWTGRGGSTTAGSYNA